MEDVAGRLENWKFSQALAALNADDATETEIHIIGSLSRMFGNVGWFDGEMSVIVATVVEYLLTDSPKEADAAVHQC